MLALQGAMQRVKARPLVVPVRLESTIQELARATQHLVFNVRKAPLAPQARHLAICAQQDAIQQQARHPARSVVLVNIHLHSLQHVRVVIVDTTRKNHHQFAVCVRLEPSVTQRHHLDVFNAHQDTTQLRAQRVVLPAPD